jgi:Na+/H+ antiporter NhaD/arsenite permease-like protein
MPGPEVHIPLYLVLPFALTLAGIAILPLAAPHFWESNRNKALFAAALALPVAGFLLAYHPHGLLHSVQEYLSFMILLGSLYTISGGVHLAGDLVATPRHNVAMLATGALLANVLGTTGASMLLVRPLLRTNSQRKNVAHIPFFFILIASNCGGLLTPLGDPPLFLGFLRGVPFTWTLRLLPVWALAVSYLLGLFYVIDRRAYATEALANIARDVSEAVPISVVGKRNLVMLGGVVLAVFMDAPFREAFMLGMVALSMRWGRQEARDLNRFTWGPMLEVAVLFAGIFVTMVPALALLNRHGAALGLVRPWQFFLASGALSSVLDNAPTYLSFLSAAQGLKLHADTVGVPDLFLIAISCGSVIMGANTYIGNGPNFMVKAIAEEAGYPMPTFFGYAGRAVLTLAPVYVAFVLLMN